MLFRGIPSELIKSILGFLGETLATNKASSNSSIHSFSLVSKRFREITLNTAEFWTRIVIVIPNKNLNGRKELVEYRLNESFEKHFEQLLKNIPVWIQKSNKLPLEIIIIDRVLDLMVQSGADINRIWEVLLLAAPRWRSLQFQGDYSMCSAFVERCAEVVALESLELNLRTSFRGNAHVPLSLLNLPKLKQLTLKGAGGSLPSLSCPLLESVDISFYRISLLEICNLASGCQHITDLKLRSSSLTPNVQPGDIPDFPNLRSCHIPGNHAHIVDMLAAAPKLTTVTLETHSFLPQSNLQTLNITHLNLHIEPPNPFRASPPLGDTLASFPRLIHLSLRPILRLTPNPSVKSLIEKLTFHAVSGAFELQVLTLKFVNVPFITLLQFSSAAKLCSISANQCDFDSMKFEDLRGVLASEAGFLSV